MVLFSSIIVILLTNYTGNSPVQKPSIPLFISDKGFQSCSISHKYLVRPCRSITVQYGPFLPAAPPLPLQLCCLTQDLLHTPGPAEPTQTPQPASTSCPASPCGYRCLTLPKNTQADTVNFISTLLYRHLNIHLFIFVRKGERPNFSTHSEHHPLSPVAPPGAIKTLIKN